MPGQFDIENVYNAGVENTSEKMETVIEEPSTSKSKNRASMENKPKWSKTHNYKFEKQPFNNEQNLQKVLIKDSLQQHQKWIFLGILYLTGYNTLPTIRSYWSNQATLGVEFVKEAMSRDRFERIKQNFHVCDNKNINKNDKFAKVTPLNEALNKNFLQFGIFCHNLSVDEQMIAYYGRHSLKMFIKGKPIRL